MLCVRHLIVSWNASELWNYWILNAFIQRSDVPLLRLAKSYQPVLQGWNFGWPPDHCPSISLIAEIDPASCPPEVQQGFQQPLPQAIIEMPHLFAFSECRDQ
jgi:hypothetical protein